MAAGRQPRYSQITPCEHSGSEESGPSADVADDDHRPLVAQVDDLGRGRGLGNRDIGGPRRAVAAVGIGAGEENTRDHPVQIRVDHSVRSGAGEPGRHLLTQGLAVVDGVPSVEILVGVDRVEIRAASRRHDDGRRCRPGRRVVQDRICLHYREVVRQSRRADVRGDADEQQQRRECDERERGSLHPSTSFRFSHRVPKQE